LSADIDHLVVGAASLEQGMAFVERELHVFAMGGGKHEFAGTHNRLLRLGQSTYLEIIAVDPDAPAPLVPRWFSLDSKWLQDLLALKPRLLTWVVRTDDVRRLSARCSLPLGEVKSASRDRWQWLITLQPDGAMSGDGVVPLLIQWQAGTHPAELLPDVDCRLMALEATHRDPKRIGQALASLGLTASIQVYPPEDDDEVVLAAYVSSPAGLVRLEGVPVTGYRWRS
jgi:hypothetical protein